MAKKVFFGVIIVVCAAAVHAQIPTHAGDMPIGMDEHSMDFLPMSDDFQLMGKAGGSVTAEEVGDPDSFGRNKTYLGLAQTMSVHLRDDCSSYPPEAGPCIEINPAPASTSVDEFDLGVIELPGNATKSIICFTFTPFATWEWFNGTGSPQTATMFLRPAVRIESDVLNDPSLIDPGTGLPFNGTLVDTTVSTFLQSRTLDPDESDYQFNATTRSCTGGLVSIRALRNGYGLSDRVIRDFFKNPITITFGVRGTVAMVTSANYSVGIRLYGD